MKISSSLKRHYLLMLVSLYLQCINLGNTQGVGPRGILYAEYKLGYFENTQPNASTKIGKACITRYFFFFSNGDSSTEAAARQAGITQIKSMHKEVKNFLSIYTTLCTVVSGN